MKSFVSLSVLGLVLMSASNAHALVAQVANCVPVDRNTCEAYRVVVLDNQGIGPVRSSHFAAEIYRAEGFDLPPVASYAVAKEVINTRDPIWIHATIYKDQKQDGSDFILRINDDGMVSSLANASMTAEINGVRVQQDLRCETRFNFHI